MFYLPTTVTETWHTDDWSFWQRVWSPEVVSSKDWLHFFDTRPYEACVDTPASPFFKVHHFFLTQQLAKVVVIFFRIFFKPIPT